MATRYIPKNPTVSIVNGQDVTNPAVHSALHAPARAWQYPARPAGAHPRFCAGGRHTPSPLSGPFDGSQALISEVLVKIKVCI